MKCNFKDITTLIVEDGLIWLIPTNENMTDKVRFVNSIEDIKTPEFYMSKINYSSFAYWIAGMENYIRIPEMFEQFIIYIKEVQKHLSELEDYNEDFFKKALEGLEQACIEFFKNNSYHYVINVYGKKIYFNDKRECEILDILNKFSWSNINLIKSNHVIFRKSSLVKTYYELLRDKEITREQFDNFVHD